MIAELDVFAQNVAQQPLQHDQVPASVAAQIQNQGFGPSHLYGAYAGWVALLVNKQKDTISPVAGSEIKWRLARDPPETHSPACGRHAVREICLDVLQTYLQFRGENREMLARVYGDMVTWNINHLDSIFSKFLPPQFVAPEFIPGSDFRPKHCHRAWIRAADVIHGCESLATLYSL